MDTGNLTNSTTTDSSQALQDLDLSRQLCNLLFLKPLFQLDLNKQRFSDAPGGERGFFQGLDTNYMALRALDLMMEGTTIASGCTTEEVIGQLSDLAQRMNPSLSRKQQVRAAETVLAALDNKANNYKEFVFDYYAASAGESRQCKFRLVSFEPGLDDVYRYRPTQEGYLIYLGMLDLPPEVSQEMMGKMIALLVERGLIQDAVEIARRAKALSQQYRQAIRDKLTQAYRSPGTINWVRDLGPELDQARVHVKQRQVEDQRMEESVLDSLRANEDKSARQNLSTLLMMVQGASLTRSQLLNEIVGSNDRFLEAQRSLFKARRPTGLPDLDAQLLPQLVDSPVGVLAAGADDVLSALYPPAWPKLYDLNSVFSLLLEQRNESAEPELDDGVITPFDAPKTEFSEADVKLVTSWLASKLTEGRRYTVDELDALAQVDGLSWSLRRCLVLQVFREFSTIENNFKNYQAVAHGEFSIEVAQGTNLQLSPLGQ